MNPLRRLLDLLPGWKKVGDRQFMARCPAHDDSTPSLSIKEADDGKVLVHCHAGCDSSDVVSAVNLSLKDLWPTTAPSPTKASPSPNRAIEYDYRDENGRLLFQVVRFPPKLFRQRKPNGAGGWSWKVNGVRRVPYKLPELLRAAQAGGEVWVAEGEKDVETLCAHGFTATTNAGGVGKWQADFAEAFRGAKSAYVIPDADEVGRRHADDVAAALARVVPEVKIVVLPDGAKDATEFFDAGSTVEQLKALAVAASAWSSSGGSEVPPLGLGTGNQFPEPVGTTGTTLFETAASFIERAGKSPAQSWLLDRLIPADGKVLMVSAPNAGKTWLALIIVRTAAELGRECFLVAEEGSLRSMGDRMRHLDLGRHPNLHVAHLKGVSLDDAEMLKQLEEQLARAAAPVLVLDPLNAIWDGDENESHASTKLRQKLDQLCRANPKALVVLLHHTSKAGERGDGLPMYASRGSSVFSAWADAQLNLTHVATPQGEGHVAFDALVAKMRDGERGHRCRFRVELGSGVVTREEVEERAPAPEALKPRVVAAMGDAKTALSKNQLAKVVKARKEDVFACVDLLVVEGVAKADTQGGFRLADEGTKP